MAFEGLTEKLQGALRKLSSKGKLTEQDVKESMREVRMALLEADVNYAVAKDFIKKVTERCIGQEITTTLTASQQVISIVRDEMTQLMGGENAKLTWSSSPLTVYMLCGLQGAGKTTMAAKLAGWLVKQGKKPMLAACDIYRPAAIKQLQVVGEQVKVPVYEHGTQDPIQTAKEAVERARYLGRDVLIIDTAGRLQIDEVLMDELVRIKEAIKPQEILLVIDAMIGQESVNVAKAFNEKLEVDGVILTKLDGDTRGGAALSVRAVTGKPIKFSGIGEKLSEIEPFHPDRMASRILGMGDVLTLIEKAEKAFDMQKAQQMEERLRSNRFTLQDYYDQLVQIKNMGSMEEILAQMPGGANMKGLKVDEKQMARTEAIILSMTPYEREHPNVIAASRKKRIAAGAGVRVEDVNKLLKSFEQMRKLMKQFNSPGMAKKIKRMSRFGGGFPGM